MAIDRSLLERESTKEAVLAVGRELASRQVVVDIDAIKSVMGWEWFEAVYAVSFHKAWDALGISRSAPGTTWH